MENIRLARADEAAALSELALRSKAYWGYDEQFMARCREELTLAPADVEAHPTCVLERDGELLGFYALQSIASDRMELTFLFVEPSAIGGGYGRALIEHAKSYSRERGCCVLEVQGDPNAVEFYRAAGGRLVGERASASVAGRMLPLFEIDVGK